MLQTTTVGRPHWMSWGLILPLLPGALALDSSACLVGIKSDNVCHRPASQGPSTQGHLLCEGRPIPCFSPGVVGSLPPVPSACRKQLTHASANASLHPISPGKCQGFTSRRQSAYSWGWWWLGEGRIPVLAPGEFLPDGAPSPAPRSLPAVESLPWKIPASSHSPSATAVVTDWFLGV